MSIPYLAIDQRRAANKVGAQFVFASVTDFTRRFSPGRRIPRVGLPVRRNAAQKVV